MSSSSRKVQLQVVGLGSFLKVVEQHIKEGASVVMSNKVGEAPHVKGKWYCCYVEYNSKAQSPEEVNEKWESGELGQSEEHVVVSAQSEEVVEKALEEEHKQTKKSVEDVEAELEGLTKAEIIKKVKADTGEIIIRSNKNLETIKQEAVQFYLKQ